MNPALAQVLLLVALVAVPATFSLAGDHVGYTYTLLLLLTLAVLLR